MTNQGERDGDPGVLVAKLLEYCSPTEVYSDKYIQSTWETTRERLESARNSIIPTTTEFAELLAYADSNATPFNASLPPAGTPIPKDQKKAMKTKWYMMTSNVVQKFIDIEKRYGIRFRTKKKKEPVGNVSSTGCFNCRVR